MAARGPYAKALRPLLPSRGQAEPAPERPPSPSSRRRHLVVTACENCRKRKAKCSGEEPSCENCRKRNETCVYDLERGKARYQTLAKKHESLEKADADLQELVHALQRRPDHEALDILRRLRSETDALAVLSYIRDGDLLLQASSREAGDSSKNRFVEQARSTDPEVSRCLQCGKMKHDCRCSGVIEGATSVPSFVQREKRTRVDFNEDDALGARSAGIDQRQNFSRSEDEAQTRVLQRKHLEIEQRNEAYNNLYSLIANKDEAVAAAIFRRLRNGDDVHKVLAFVQNGDPKAALHLNSRAKFRQALLSSLGSSTASLQEIIDFIDITAREIPTSAPSITGLFEPLRNRIIDLTMLNQVLQRKQRPSLEDTDREKQAQDASRMSIPLFERDNQQSPFIVPAWPWTRLTTNDVFVSRLVNLFFSYLNIYLKCVEEEPFLEGMRSGRTDSEFCSPLLVNAICAYACIFSEDAEAFVEPGELVTRGEHFHLEALRLWLLEEGRASLPNLQSLPLLMMESSMRGKDKMGVSFLLLAVQMNKSLSFSKLSYSDSFVQAHYQGARQSIAWTVCFSELVNSNSLLRARAPFDARLDKSQIEIPLPDVVEWSGYPLLTQSKSLPYKALFEKHCELFRLNSRSNDLIYSTDQVAEKASFEDNLKLLIQDYFHWRNDLPGSLKYSDMLPKPLFELHADYLGSIIGLLNSPKIRYLYDEITPIKISNVGGNPIGPGSSRNREWIKFQMVSAACEAATLLRDYRRLYGLKIVTPLLVQLMGVSVFALLEHLPRSNQAFPSTRESMLESNRDAPLNEWTPESAFQEIFRCLLGAGMQFMLTRGIARMVYRTAEQMHIRLPVRINKILEIATTLAWRPKDLHQLSSIYPSMVIVNERKDENVEMEQLLKTWETLDMDDRGHSDDQSTQDV